VFTTFNDFIELGMIAYLLNISSGFTKNKPIFIKNEDNRLEYLSSVSQGLKKTR